MIISPSRTDSHVNVIALTPHHHIHSNNSEKSAGHYSGFRFFPGLTIKRACDRISNNTNPISSCTLPLLCKLSVPFRCLTRILCIFLISTYVLFTLPSKVSQNIIFFFLLLFPLIYDQTFFSAPYSPM
jgi:hypothetical protein